MSTVRSDSEASDSDLLCEIHSLGTGKPKPNTVVLEIYIWVPSFPRNRHRGSCVFISERTKKELTWPAAGRCQAPHLYCQVHSSAGTGVHLSEVACGGSALLGRDLLSKMKTSSVKLVAVADRQLALDKLSEKYSEVFQPGLGTMTKIKAHLSLKPDASDSILFATSWCLATQKLSISGTLKRPSISCNSMGSG